MAALMLPASLFWLSSVLKRIQTAPVEPSWWRPGQVGGRTVGQTDGRWQREGEALHLGHHPHWCGEQAAGSGTEHWRCCKASMGNGNQEQGNLWWDVGRTRLLAVKIVPGFLTAGLVGHLINNCEWNDLVHTPGVLGLCKTEGWKAAQQLEVHQWAGRSRRSSIGCEAPEHPALGKQLRLLPPTLQDLGLGL